MLLHGVGPADAGYRSASGLTPATIAPAAGEAAEAVLASNEAPFLTVILWCA